MAVMALTARVAQDVINIKGCARHEFRALNMRKLFSLTLMVVLFGMTSCMDTFYVTEKTKFDDAVAMVRSQLKEKGFNLTGTNSITRNEPFVTDVTSSYGLRMDNNYITQDTYRFTDSLGNTMSYSVSYHLKQESKGVPYVQDVEVCGCETSNPKDFETFCDGESEIYQIKNIPKEQTIKQFNYVKTSGLVAVFGLVLVLVMLATS